MADSTRRTRSKVLTAAFVRTVKEPGRYGDGGRGSNGLYLRVWTRTNKRTGKSWAQRIRLPNGKRTNLGLGRYPAVGLAMARDRAVANLRAVEQGRDPRRATVPTFRQAAERVIAARRPSWKSPGREARQWRSSLSVHVYPVLGDKRVNAITRADVLAAISGTWTEKPAAAKLALSRIRAVLDWATGRGFAESNPADKGVEAALPRQTRRVRHVRAVHHSEVPAVLAKIEASTATKAVRLALRWAVLTASRPGEATGLLWSEVDMAAKVATIGPDRMKAGREHRIPLSPEALAVLAEARTLGGRRGLVFPTLTGRRIAPATFLALLRRLDVDSTAHGFRSSFSSWAADSGVDREVREAALAHVVKGVEGAYQRSDLFDARRAIFEAWADYASTG